MELTHALQKALPSQVPSYTPGWIGHTIVTRIQTHIHRLAMAPKQLNQLYYTNSIQPSSELTDGMWQTVPVTDSEMQSMDTMINLTLLMPSSRMNFQTSSDDP